MLTGRWYGLVQVTSVPPMLIDPDVGCSRPATIRSVVVLPQPDGPSRAKNEPGRDVEVDPVDRDEVPELLADAAQGQAGARRVTRTAGHRPITSWNCVVNSVSSSALRLRNSLTLARNSSVGKMYGFSASSGSMSTMASWAPLTGQM